jgi:hypothetical protein
MAGDRVKWRAAATDVRKRYASDAAAIYSGATLPATLPATLTDT